MRHSETGIQYVNVLWITINSSKVSFKKIKTLSLFNDVTVQKRGLSSLRNKEN